MSIWQMLWPKKDDMDWYRDRAEEKASAQHWKDPETMKERVPSSSDNLQKLCRTLEQRHVEDSSGIMYCCHTGAGPGEIATPPTITIMRK